MKKKRVSKWLKWQVGAAGMLGLAVLFHSVKDSTIFAQAVDNAKSSNQNTQQIATSQNDWMDNSYSSNSSENYGSSSNQTGFSDTHSFASPPRTRTRQS